jgi:hypothetical protein
MTKKNQNLNEDLLGDLGTQARKLFNSPIVKTLTSAIFGDEEGEEESSAGPGAAPDKGILSRIENYIEDLITEKIPLNDALKASPRTQALIVGSSQSGVIGPLLMRQLEQMGFDDFKFMPEPGRRMSEIYSAVNGLPDKSTYDIVVIMPGYRGGENPFSVINIVELFEPARCFVLVPPPVTTITNTFKAAKLGLNSGRAIPPDYWFKLSGGKYSERREQYCERLKNMVTTAGATVIDPRDVVPGGDMQPSGVSYPNMEDGIHPGDTLITTIVNAIADVIQDCDLPVTAGSVIKKITPADLESKPQIAAALKKYPAAANVVNAAMGKITSGLGPRDLFGVHRQHQGLDIGIPVGTPVQAALGGKVVSKYNHPVAGNYVEIKHDNGTTTRYLHLSGIDVEDGDVVETGEVIGKSGGARGAPGSGRTTGPHLHWETWKGPYKTGTLINPLEWLEQTPDAIKPVKFA